MQTSNRYKQLSLGLLALVIFASGFAWLVRARANDQDTNRLLRVTATFYPMAEFARRVGGDKVSVTTLVRPGVEPHDYDPTPRDVAGIYDSRVFVYNGAGLERWVDKISHDLAAKGVVSVRASNGVPLLAKDPSDTENLSPNDPHIWMDPKLAIKEVENIRDGLVKADPTHSEDYHANARAYITALTALSDSFKKGLANCSLHTIITSHQAFGYLSKEYGITSVGIAGLSPEDEPSPQKLAEITDIAKASGVRYIFFEDLVSPKLSQTIAQEVGAKTIAFNPLEGLTSDQVKAGQDYISVQKDNLQALRTALDCK